jgi:hypothetical protein
MCKEFTKYFSKNPIELLDFLNYTIIFAIINGVEQKTART